jgi:DNA-binding PucR family transcriptional regulator
VDPAALASTLVGLRPGAVVAVGLPRSSLAGAARSLRDAQRVLAASLGAEGIRRFEDHWLAAVLLEHSADLLGLVEARLDTVRANPRLADAVRAFAEDDLSATAAAGRLGVHPNTVMYRLARWQEQTGWDPRTFAGLSSSLLACWLAAARPPSA